MKRSGGFGQDVSSYYNFSHHTPERDYFKKSTVLLAKRKSIDVPELKQNKAKQKCPPSPKMWKRHLYTCLPETTSQNS